MKTKFGATVLATAFLAALVIPWTVLAGGGGGGRGGGGMSGASIRNQTQMQNNFQNRGIEQLRQQDRDRQQSHKVSGTGSSTATTGSAVSATGEKTKKGNAYGPGDGSGPFHPEDGTGYGAPANR
ncbi:MAG: hypothetical protein H6Q82_1771 [Deltaproteobacteria bacterium]|nr:hypothetical protein [Deltaproteobacteria bacterium]